MPQLALATWMTTLPCSTNLDLIDTRCFAMLSLSFIHSIIRPDIAAPGRSNLFNSGDTRYLIDNNVENLLWSYCYWLENSTWQKRLLHGEVVVNDSAKQNLVANTVSQTNHNLSNTSLNMASPFRSEEAVGNVGGRLVRSSWLNVNSPSTDDHEFW